MSFSMGRNLYQMGDFYPMFKPLIGKVIQSVDLSAGKEKITFAFADSTEKSFRVEGDCCSESWIEHLETPNNIVGATLLDVIEEDRGEIKHPDHECLQVYQTIFRTDRGDIVLEYRNSSNGYYGGYLVEG